ncbi:MAG TPA: hypothetical protein VHF89_08165 [Solirubrobacteraceae bacterium]|nr:hypothetical protein [Solirubrobacteraceae bacterium]
MPASLRSGFGPSLPALLRDRFGIAPRTTLLVAVGAAVLLAGGVLLAVRLSADAQLVHRGEPVFNLLYDDAVLAEKDPRPGELARLEGRRGRVSVAVSVRPLRLPPFRGDVAKGLLPVHAERYMDDLRRRDPTFVIRDEGRSTVNDSPGYQIAYRTGTPGAYTFWREIFVVPDEEAPRSGVVLSFENRRPDRIGAAAREFVDTGKSAFRSFRFGTGRG